MNKKRERSRDKDNKESSSDSNKLSNESNNSKKQKSNNSINSNISIKDILNASSSQKSSSGTNNSNNSSEHNVCFLQTDQKHDKIYVKKISNDEEISKIQSPCIIKNKIIVSEIIQNFDEKTVHEIPVSSFKNVEKKDLIYFDKNLKKSSYDKYNNIQFFLI